MGKALRVGVRSGRELRLIRMLTRGVIDFDDLNDREKLALIESPMDISTVVDEEKLRRFQKEMSLNNAVENPSMIRQIVKTITDRLPRRLDNGKQI